MTCPCGGIILADTEDWRIPMCYSCSQPIMDLLDAFKFYLQYNKKTRIYEVATDAINDFHKEIKK